MKRLRLELAFFIGVRTVLNTAYRMVYPFLPVFGRALGLDLRSMSATLTARGVAGTAGPLLAPLTDRRGRRFGMLLGLGLFTAGAAAPLIGPGLPFFLAALVLATIGKYTFDPAMQARIGDRIPYGRRGLPLAVAELGWSLAFILGVPAAGFLLGRFGWRSPFLAVACLGLAAFVSVRLFFPADGKPAVEESASSRETVGSDHARSYLAVARSAPARVALAVIFFASASNEVVNVVFGVWLEDSFGLRLAALGAASAAIGLAEFGGEGLVAVTIDRLGKTRAVMFGLAANAAAALLLPAAGRTTLGAVVGLFAFYFTFEYTAVSIIPVMSEILVEARATLLAFYTAAFSLGRAAAAWLSPRLYGLGFPAVALAAVVLNALAFAALLRFRRLTAGKH